MATAHDVDSDGVRLRVLDHGGAGPAAVVMPGAGGNLHTWDAVARRLDGSVRLVSMDIRSHGQSDLVDDFSAPSLVRDVEAVVAALDLGNPVVAGHSLGGMIAAHYGAAHPECPMAINVDGHGRGGPSVPPEVLAELERLGDERSATATLPADEGDDAWFAGELDAARELTERFGGRWDRVEPSVRGSFASTGEGRWQRRPPFAWLRDVMQPELDGWDLFALYRRVVCPLTIVTCTASTDDGPVPAELMAAYRVALRHDLDQLVADRPQTTVVEIETDHVGVMFAGATQVSALLRAATP